MVSYSSTGVELSEKPRWIFLKINFEKNFFLYFPVLLIFPVLCLQTIYKLKLWHI